MFKSALLILSGQTFTSILLLLRNLLVARLISVEDYGIAATFAISMSIVEMMTTIGLHQMIIQDKNGDDPRLQSVLQGFHLFRSLFAGLILFLLAHPIAEFIGAEDIAWAYQVLALIPVLNGLTHFDIYRLQRKMIYKPSILSSAIPAFLSVMAIWPLWKLYGDYRVMLYSVMIQSAAMVITSQVVAERRYSLGVDKTILMRAINFGWPLLINNVLLFFIFQGEKIIVGRTFGLEVLAIFAMGFTLTLTPSLLLGGSTQTFFLPQLVAAKEDPEKFGYLSCVTYQAHFVFATLFVIGAMIFSDPVIHLLLSAKYAGLIPLMTLLAVLQSMRLLRGGSSTIALAVGRTGIATLSNLPRVFSMPLAWFVASWTGDIFTVLWVAIAGEVIGFLISLFLVRRQAGVPLDRLAPSLILTAAVLGFAGVQTFLTKMEAGAPLWSYWTSVPIALFFVLSLISMKDLRHYLVTRKTWVAHK
jgi:O-antigen/teichoic acid export membrane protein